MILTGVSVIGTTHNPTQPAGERPSAEQILRWHDILANGGGVTTGEHLSYSLAIVRWMNGLGPDPTDDHGEDAMAFVLSVLETA